MMVGVHQHSVAVGRFDLLAIHCLPHRIDIGGPRLLDSMGPHLKTDVGRLHRVVGHTLGVLDVVVPLLDEGRVGRVFQRLKIVPGREVANQVAGIDTGKLLLADRKGNNRNIGGLNVLLCELLVKWDVRIAVDGRYHGRFFPGRAKTFDRAPPRSANPNSRRGYN